MTSSAQVVVSGGFLLISAVEDGDQGEYTCSASNSVGTASASATLLVFSELGGAVKQRDRVRNKMHSEDFA